MFPGSKLQIAMTLIISLAAIKIWSYTAPYVLDSDDTLAETGMWVVFTTLFGAFLFKTESVDPNGPFGIGLVLVTLMVVILAVVLLFTDLAEEREYLDRTVQRTSSMLKNSFVFRKKVAAPVMAIVKLQARVRGNQARKRAEAAKANELKKKKTRKSFKRIVNQQPENLLRKSASASHAFGTHI